MIQVSRFQTILNGLISITVAGVSDAFQHLSIDTVDARLLIWRVQEVTTLIVAVDLDSLPTDYTPHTEEALEMIEQGMY